MTDASKTLWAGRDLRLEHRGHTVTQPQVGRADDAGCHSGLAIPATGALGRNALHELGLADHSELFRTVGPIHRGALDKDGLAHAVLPGVLEQVLEEVTVARAVPQVVVRVDDRQLRFEGRLVGQGQPVLGRAATCRGLLGHRAQRHQTWQGGRGETAERADARAIKETTAREVIHAALPFQTANRRQRFVDGVSCGVPADYVPTALNGAEPEETLPRTKDPDRNKVANSGR